MSRLRTGAVDRRTFMKDAAIAAVAAGGLTGGLGALSGLLAQPLPGRSGSRLVTVTGQTRPFTMICLGDSVMWGQGLEETTKFTWLVKTWLESKLPGRTVNRFVYARSGATIAPDPEAPESGVKPWMNDRTLGEVPCSWPWVRQQVIVAGKEMASQQIAADAVDLVLVDGGINDMRVGTLLDAGKSSAEVREKSAEFCGRQMSDLLGRIRSAFPKAKILVTGYFPIVTEETDLQALGVLLALLLPVVGAAFTPVIRTKLAELSATWYQASNEDLAGAVASFNSSTLNPAGTPQAAFAKIPWGVVHSYGASSSRLYLAGLPNDPVYWQRLAACASAGAGKAGNPLCLDAKVGHPNQSGAEAYADACKAQLQRYLAEWSGAKTMHACVEMDPMPAAGVLTTLTVHATGDASGGPRPLSARVSIGGQTFATGTPIPLTLCTRQVSVEARREEGRLAGPGVLKCKPITVSAPGYMDVVIRDYLKAQPLPQ
jgi:lysophospholipase L1-like esterase